MSEKLITLRVDSELKERMDKFPNINWSEEIREAIRWRLNELELNKYKSMKDKINEFKKRVAMAYDVPLELLEDKDEDEDEQKPDGERHPRDAGDR